MINCFLFTNTLVNFHSTGKIDNLDKILQEKISRQRKIEQREEKRSLPDNIGIHEISHLQSILTHNGSIEVALSNKIFSFSEGNLDLFADGNLFCAIFQKIIDEVISFLEIKNCFLHFGAKEIKEAQMFEMEQIKKYMKNKENFFKNLSVKNKERILNIRLRLSKVIFLKDSQLMSQKEKKNIFDEALAFLFKNEEQKKDSLKKDILFYLRIMDKIKDLKRDFEFLCPIEIISDSQYVDKYANNSILSSNYAVYKGILNSHMENPLNNDRGDTIFTGEESIIDLGENEKEKILLLTDIVSRTEYMINEIYLVDQEDLNDFLRNILRILLRVMTNYLEAELVKYLSIKV